MSICTDCKQEMSGQGADTCTVTHIEYADGKRFERLTDHFDEPSGRCHDCNIKHGGLHHPGCDVERCPRCGGQLISCDCEPLT